MLIYLIIVLIIIYLIYNSNVEYFNISDMNICNDCSYKSKLECLSCDNCGYCIDEYDNERCVSGDNNGPYFDKCYSWNNSENMIIEQPFTSHYTYSEPNYRRYYGNNQGRRIRHRLFK